MEASKGPSKNSKIQLFLTLAGTAGIVGLFLPFSWDITPWDALTDGFMWSVAAPAFLVPFIFASLIRWLRSGMLPQAAKLALYGLSAVSAALTLWVIVGEDGVYQNVQEWLSSIVPLLVLAAGAWIIYSRIRKKEPETGPLIAVQAAWLANTLMCLLC